MSSYDVTLSSASRTNLLSLQNTASLAATNQQRLSTGKAVNSALDNPVNYFTASALTDRSSALNGLLDGISNGIQTIQAASKGIDGLTSLVKQLQSTISQAQSTAATNLPKITGSATSTATGNNAGSGIASVAEAAAAGKSQHDTALAKSLFGTAGAASSTSNGNVGLTSATSPATNVVRLQAGATTYDVTLSSTATVGDLVNSINKSGIANASVDNNGQLAISGVGSDALTVDSGSKNSAGVYTSGATAGTPGTPAGTDANGNPTPAVPGTSAGPSPLVSALLGASTNVTSVSGSTTSAQRSSLVQQFTDVKNQIDQLAKDSGYNGTNLLAGDKLNIVFNEKTGAAQSKISIQGNTLSASSLGIGDLVDSSSAQQGADIGVQNNADLSRAADTLTNALTSLKSLSSTLGSNLATVQTRQDFTKNLSDVLTTGASNLTDADMNAEAAKSQALSTRQSLGISALSLSNTAAQGILQLLR
jgi:flagellin-like hook-associated protein FlgL